MSQCTSGTAKNPEVIDFCLLTAATRAGIDMDNTFVMLPTEEEDTATAHELNSISDKAHLLHNNADPSRFLSWKEYLENNHFSIENLPKNSKGNRMLSGLHFSVCNSLSDFKI